MNAITHISDASMTTDRSSSITLGGVEYELLFTTYATKAISKRYGGLENLGNELEGSKDVDKSLDEIVWLISLLANQPIMIYNLWNDNKKALLTEEMVSLLTTPSDLASYKDAIITAMLKGTKREVTSEEVETKNSEDE